MANKETLMPYEISEARLAANRANAQKSTGPRTEEGKAISSRNAVTHGLYTCSFILDGEFQEAFDKLKTDYFNRLRPADGLEVQLVHNMVMLEWQIRRFRIADNSILQEAVNDPTLGGPGFTSTGVFRLSKAIEQISVKPAAQFIVRKLTQMSRELSGMLKNFFLIRKNCPQPPAQPVESVQDTTDVKNEPKQTIEHSERSEPLGLDHSWIPNKLKAFTAGQAPPDLSFA